LERVDKSLNQRKNGDEFCTPYLCGILLLDGETVHNAFIEQGVSAISVSHLIVEGIVA
jgi:hypothetical protein